MGGKGMRRLFTIRIAFNLIVVTLTIYGATLSTALAQNALNVYVVNYPLKYFAKTIGGPHVKATLPVPPDVDPAYWTPSIADIGAYQQTNLILLNGAGYAKWVSKVSLPRSKTIDTSRAFKDQYITVKAITTHSHGAEGEHAHEGLAFTTWLDLSLAVQQAESVYKALARKQPDLKAEFLANYRLLEKDLLALDRRLETIVSRNPSIPILFSHPVYDYLIARYGLNARSLHWETDQVPSKSQLMELERINRVHLARWMVWEGKPTDLAVEKLKAIGISSMVYDPCGNLPSSGDFISVMRQNIKNIESSFKNQN